MFVATAAGSKEAGDDSHTDKRHPPSLPSSAGSSLKASDLAQSAKVDKCPVVPLPVPVPSVLARVSAAQRSGPAAAGLGRRACSNALELDARKLDQTVQLADLSNPCTYVRSQRRACTQKIQVVHCVPISCKEMSGRKLVRFPRETYRLSFAGFNVRKLRSPPQTRLYSI